MSIPIDNSTHYLGLLPVRLHCQTPTLISASMQGGNLYNFNDGICGTCPGLNQWPTPGEAYANHYHGERSGSYHIGHTPYQEALWRGSGSYTNELAPYEKALWGDQVVIQMDSPHMKRHYGGRSSSYANELTRLWRGLGSYTNRLIPYEELLRGIR